MARAAEVAGLGRAARAARRALGRLRVARARRAGVVARTSACVRHTTRHTTVRIPHLIPGASRTREHKVHQEFVRATGDMESFKILEVLTRRFLTSRRVP